MSSKRNLKTVFSPVVILNFLAIAYAITCTEKERAIINFYNCTYNDTNLSTSTDANSSIVPADSQTTHGNASANLENATTMSSSNADMLSSSEMPKTGTILSSLFTKNHSRIVPISASLAGVAFRGGIISGYMFHNQKTESKSIVEYRGPGSKRGKKQNVQFRHSVIIRDYKIICRMLVLQKDGNRRSIILILMYSAEGWDEYSLSIWYFIFCAHYCGRNESY